MYCFIPFVYFLKYLFCDALYRNSLLNPMPKLQGQTPTIIPFSSFSPTHVPFMFAVYLQERVFPVFRYKHLSYGRIYIYIFPIYPVLFPFYVYVFVPIEQCAKPCVVPLYWLALVNCGISEYIGQYNPDIIINQPTIIYQFYPLIIILIVR